MTATAVHDTCPDTVEVAHEATRVMDLLADALVDASEQGCPTPAELAALGAVTAWIADDDPGADARRRLRWLVLSGLERTARVYAVVAGQSCTVDPRTAAPADRQWAASTVAALLTIRLTAGRPRALSTALATVVEHAGPDDLWSLLVETARTWGHVRDATRPTG